MKKWATISDCGLYRYDLGRVWLNSWDIDRSFVKFIMLNPSTADGEEDDPTIKKCMKFAETWGYGGIIVVNLFAFRATDPKELKKYPTLHIIGPENDKVILDTLTSWKGLNVAAWGKGGARSGRGDHVRWLLKQHGIRLHAIKLNKDGSPAHPLYLKDNTQLIENI